MSFAHWRKCDFQVHTPRDPNWTGTRPVGLGEPILATGAKANPQDVDAARMQWAKEFLNQCIVKGLQAVALTDHHEMIMVPYVQKEIEQSRKADPEFDLWLFPGMEMTASGGRQCIIIFDADLTEDWRKQAQGRLGIAFAGLEEKGAVAPKVTQLACAYPEIASWLDEVEDLRGRYIVLPNVSQGNSHTVLIDGGHGDFRRMPYVGGYLDRGQTIKTLGPKNRTRLSGTDKTWSLREIYPMPTSDSRSADYSALGENDTWIKLAEPTAEAIRQAFLGHRSVSESSCRQYLRWSPRPSTWKALPFCSRVGSRSVRNSTLSSAGAGAAKARFSNTSLSAWAGAATTRRASITLARSACTISSTIHSFPRAGACR
jgi:type III restriction enzyme